MDIQHHLELLVGGLVEHTVKGISGVVDNNVDLAKGLDGLGYEALGEGKVGNIS